ncbi:MAG: amidohydrolase family protein [Sphaerotilus sp.]|nr:amidohydrolase family protein [Sphaerotilus sp.]
MMRNEAGLVDCHFHVIAPQDRHPMLAGRSYTPAPASLSEWQSALRPCGVTHGVVVQPSFYGTDNQVLVAALEEGCGRLVGVAAVAADVCDAELDRLAAAGVRGVRMAYFEPGDPRAMGGFVPFSSFDGLEARLHARHMHLQLFTDSRLLPCIADRLMASQVPVVIDHMGRAPAALGARHVGIQTLTRLMADGPVWVKLSGVANVSDAGPDHEDARAVHDALLAAVPDRLLWGSDWPHTKPSGTKPLTAALVRLFQAWTPHALLNRVGQANALSFYRF